MNVYQDFEEPEQIERLLREECPSPPRVPKPWRLKYPVTKKPERVSVGSVADLPLVRVVLCGRHVNAADYDFLEDVRELVCEPIRFEVYAMWSDPRERLGLD